MLGPIGKSVKGALTKAGYEVTRATGLERTGLRSFWEDWYSKDPALFGKLYAANRATLRDVGEWIKEADLAGSLWRYGVPEEWNTRRQGLGRTGLNEMEAEPTYTDLIAFIASQIPDLNYLEIGVSVGKNWLQIIENFPDAAIFGLDVEKPNPTVAKRFQDSKVVHTAGKFDVETLSGTPAAVQLEHIEFTRAGLPVTYVRGDQFAPETWASLRGKQFNFIFSDGVHSARAIEGEMDHLLSNELLADGPFVMYWDDLVNTAMQSAFERNVALLTKRYGPDSWSGLYQIHGTYGAKRMNGIFCSFTSPSYCV